MSDTVEKMAEPETKPAETKEEPETKPAETKEEPETKPAETKEEPETKPAETKEETKAENKPEPEVGAEREATSMVGELEIDIEIKSSTEQFHHMFVKRPHHVSKATPGTIAGVELHEGEWDKVGSIVVWNYFHDGVQKVAKDRIEEVDPEKNLIRFRVIEGDVLKEYKTFLLSLQVTPKKEGSGSMVKWHIKYERKDEKVAHPETLLPFLEAMSKEIDEHLLSTE